ncbi:hypothetical protein DFH09DRAFT_1075850 [Mycena vulgaris]|nr:hypothetical protein DFH09DRAFT_1108910 [Mycena vulgaris]KAJ6583430.1 hypothetical protein DFH09DRAFT_1075850 [Mycena vulgaris]
MTETINMGSEWEGSSSTGDRCLSAIGGQDLWVNVIGAGKNNADVQRKLVVIAVRRASVAWTGDCHQIPNSIHIPSEGGNFMPSQTTGIIKQVRDLAIFELTSTGKVGLQDLRDMVPSGRLVCQSGHNMRRWTAPEPSLWNQTIVVMMQVDGVGSDRPSLPMIEWVEMEKVFRRPRLPVVVAPYCALLQSTTSVAGNQSKDPFITSLFLVIVDVIDGIIHARVAFPLP